MEEDRILEWRRTRRYGFMSFIIPSSMVFLLSTKVWFSAWILQCFLKNSDPSVLQSFGGSAHEAFFSGWDIEPLQKTALYFSLWAAKEVILNLFKYWLMVKTFGMSKVCRHIILCDAYLGTTSDANFTYQTQNNKRAILIEKHNCHFLSRPIWPLGDLRPTQPFQFFILININVVSVYF